MNNPPFLEKIFILLDRGYISIIRIVNLFFDKEIGKERVHLR